jgi:uncharacterized coiled-coil protein SlyX
MPVEVYLRKADGLPDTETSGTAILPDSMLELESMLYELEFTLSKLRESTDLLTEEFRKAEGEVAREYYEYIQDNMEIMKQKVQRITDIKQRIDQIRGVFPSSNQSNQRSHDAAGGVQDLVDREDGHLL